MNKLCKVLLVIIGLIASSCYYPAMFTKPLSFAGKVFSSQGISIDSVQVTVYLSTYLKYYATQTTDTAHICRRKIPSQFKYLTKEDLNSERFNKLDTEWCLTTYTDSVGKFSFQIDLNTLRHLQGYNDDHQEGISYDGFLLIFSKEGKYQMEYIFIHPYCIESIQALQHIELKKIE